MITKAKSKRTNGRKPKLKEPTAIERLLKENADKEANELAAMELETERSSEALGNILSPDVNKIEELNLDPGGDATDEMMLQGTILMRAHVAGLLAKHYEKKANTLEKLAAAQLPINF